MTDSTLEPWRLPVFLPVADAAAGFLQHRLYFCAAYGFRGVANVSAPAGNTEDVMSAEFRKQDRCKAQQIMSLSNAIGTVVTTITFLV